jgi:hypothetical protein
MRSSLSDSARVVISSDRRTGPGMAKADLRKTDHWIVMGRAVDRTRTLCRLSIKEFADLIDRDEAQVRRWIAGTEQTQAAVIFAVQKLRRPFVIALAEEAGEGVTVTTQITVEQRTA